MLSDQQRAMLHGLAQVHSAYVSATEHYDAMMLCAKGLARKWEVATGPTVWQITDAGHAELRQ